MLRANDKVGLLKSAAKVQHTTRGKQSRLLNIYIAVDRYLGSNPATRKQILQIPLVMQVLW